MPTIAPSPCTWKAIDQIACKHLCSKYNDVILNQNCEEELPKRKLKCILGGY